MTETTSPAIAGLRHLLAARDEDASRDGPAIGWKAGLGSRAAVVSLGTDGPLVGYLPARTELPSGTVVDVRDWVGPLLEPEIAITFGSRLSPDGRRGDVFRAIAWLSPAFELIDVPPVIGGIEEILAGDIFHRHSVFGAPVATRIADLRGSEAVIAVDGSEVVRTRELEEVTGPLEDIVLHVARSLGAVGTAIAPGDRLICGSIVPPIPFAPGIRVEYRLGSADPIDLSAAR